MPRTDHHLPRAATRSTWAAAVLVLLAACALFAPTAQAATKPVSQEEYRLFSEAQRALQQNNIERAARVLDQYFNRSGVKHPLSYELYGYALLHQNRTERAIEILEEGYKAYPDNGAIVRNLGTGYARQGNNRLAGRMFLEAYTLGGRSKPLLAYSAAVFFHRAEASGEAWNVLQPLLERPEAKPTWFVLAGHCLLQMKDYDKAASVLSAGLKIDPKDARLWRTLGFVQFKRGENRRAAAAYEVAHRLAPPSDREASQLAMLYCSLGAPLLGEKTIETSDADARLLDNLAYGLAQSGDLDKALSKAKQAMDIAPSDERRFRVGGILVRLDRKGEAREVFQKLAAKSGPYQGRALWTLAMMAWSAGDWPKTMAALDQASRTDAKLKKRAERLLSVMEAVADKESQ